MLGRFSRKIGKIRAYRRFWKNTKCESLRASAQGVGANPNPSKLVGRPAHSLKMVKNANIDFAHNMLCLRLVFLPFFFIALHSRFLYWLSVFFKRGLDSLSDLLFWWSACFILLYIVSCFYLFLSSFSAESMSVYFSFWAAFSLRKDLKYGDLQRMLWPLFHRATLFAYFLASVAIKARFLPFWVQILRLSADFCKNNGLEDKWASIRKQPRFSH